MKISSGATVNTSYAQVIYLQDTSSAASLGYGLLVDMTQTTNNNATANAITATARTQNAGNLLLLNTGGTGYGGVGE
ncbi:hypothetical protein IPL68_04580 [Candidatus Saccharibacteria bacterium]|nr:MAG: hypothetical protein IPL68_04580 [Candidatus Saccharibacteria bacterium]